MQPCRACTTCHFCRYASYRVTVAVTVLIIVMNFFNLAVVVPVMRCKCGACFVMSACCEVVGNAAKGKVHMLDYNW